MKSPRALVAVAALLALAVLLIWWRNAAATPASGLPSGANDPDAALAAASAAAAGAIADANAPQNARADASADVDPNAPVFTVRGHVLADRRVSVNGVEVVAYAGKAGERGGMLSMMSAASAANAERADFPIMTSGTALARVPVAADGSFVLTTRQPHLRLAIEHDLYGLALPEIVHVPASSRTADVVLAPYLGGCLHGRLFGGDPAQVRGIRLSMSPDPMSVIRDPKGFLGTLVRATRPAEQPTAQGTFTFRAVAPGAQLTLLAEGDDATGRTVQPPLEPGEVRDVALPLVRAAQVSVRVVDEAGAPVAEARVTAQTDEAHDAMTRQLGAARVHTGADGAALLRGLAPGSYTLRASADGYLEAQARAEVPNAADATLTLRRGAAIAGIVVGPTGEPIEGAHVGSMPGMEVPMLGDLTAQLGLDALSAIAAEGPATDAAGRFRLSGMDADAQQNVIAMHADFAPGIAKAVRAGDLAVRIELQPATALVARVVADEDGTPLPAFSLELRMTMFAMLERPVRTLNVSDAADGTARLHGLAAGDFTLAARAEGRSEAVQSVRLVAGAEPAVHELRLARAASVSGRVVDEAGHGIAGALVQRSRGGIHDNPVMAMLQGGDSAARADARGAFVLAGLQPGRVQIAATADGFASGKSARLELEAGATVSGIDITLDHGGSIDGVLRTVRGDLAEDFTVIVQSAATQKTATCTPAVDGTFRVQNLDPGTWQVQAMHPSAVRMMQRTGEMEPGRNFDLKGMIARVTDSTVSTRCTVRAGAATAVELDASDLGSGTRLSLRVLIGGQPLATGFVEATIVDDGRIRVGFLDAGEVTFAALRPGQLRVQVRTGMTMTPVGAPQFLDVPIGIDHHRATIELPGGELSGRVIDEGGNPLPAVLVRLLRSSNHGDDDLFGTAITDGNGEFAFRALQPDTYGLVAADALLQRSGGGSASRVEGLRVGDGEHRSGIELRAQPAVGASVTVTDTAGAPLAGATLVAVDSDGRALGNFALGVAGADGKALLGGLPRGSLCIVGRAAGFAPEATAPVDALPGQTIELALQLQRGTRVAVDARSRDGQPLTGADVRARCNGGPWFPALLLLEGRSSDGRFELGRLGAGNWDFRIEHPTTGSFTVSRTIADGPTVTILAVPTH